MKRLPAYLTALSSLFLLTGKAAGADDICDAQTLARAGKLAVFAERAVAYGLKTEEEAAGLARLAEGILSCRNGALPAVAEARARLAEGEALHNAGVMTRLEVLALQQQVTDAVFCAESLSQTAAREELVTRMEASGIASIEDFVPMLRKRLQLVEVCAK